MSGTEVNERLAMLAAAPAGYVAIMGYLQLTCDGRPFFPRLPEGL